MDAKGMEALEAAQRAYEHRTDQLRISDEELAGQLTIEGEPMTRDTDITPQEARELAESEFAFKLLDRNWCVLSRGSDRGMHFRARLRTREDAQHWVDCNVEHLVDEILAGTSTVYRTAGGGLELA